MVCYLDVVGDRSDLDHLSKRSRAVFQCRHADEITDVRVRGFTDNYPYFDLRCKIGGIFEELRGAASDEKRKVLARFFKTGPGEYGEGDRFLGVMVPQIRAVAKRHSGASTATEDALLASPWHEARECGLFMMCNRFGRAPEEERAEIHRRYLAAAAAGRVNNWDLVDLSAPTLVGQHLADKSRALLYDLARRPSLWENRIAIVSTLYLVRRGDMDDAFRLAEALLAHPHDLMHKAVGWVLRECGKRDADRLRAFLREHLAALPRTALRYAIERFPADERRRWLAMPPKS